MTRTEAFVVAAISALLIFLVAGSYHREKVEMPRAYQAWVKQTGNTNQITYAEWRAMISATQQQNTHTVYMIGR